MNDPHTTILDAFFWHFVDQGDPLQSTPLFTGVHEGEPLVELVASQFALSREEAASVIEAAQQEVAL
jgi:hypothetical protein